MICDDRRVGGAQLLVADDAAALAEREPDLAREHHVGLGADAADDSVGREPAAIAEHDGGDALVAVEGKPAQFLSQVRDNNLHLVSVEYDKALRGEYLPAQLSAEDYPNLISGSAPVGTSWMMMF